MTLNKIQRHCQARHSLMAQGKPGYFYTRPLMFVSSHVTLLTGLLCLSICQVVVLAEDSAAAPAFDMNALASLASNIGSNPQIMGLVSSFLNSNAPAGGGQRPAFGLSASAGVGGGGGASDMGGLSDQDPNSMVPNAGSEAPRRALKPVDAPAPPTPQQQPQAVAATSSGSTAASPAVAPANPLSGLMSMLPGIMSGLGGAGGGAGGLSGLLSGLTAKAQPAAAASAASGSATNDQPAATTGTSTAATSATAASSAPAAVQAQQPPPSPPLPPPPPAPGANPAQAVINQVLTAYAAGQIPNELIQMGVSGRVPPQIIELALSGQVPPQMIQMIITGQVPMSTINSFLSAMQGGPVRPVDSSASATASQSGAASTSASTSQPGVFSTTRALFEAMFGLGRRNGRSGGGMASILRMPGMSNVRSFGQLVGGTISNVASMIPA